jgi:hypothetical protein
MWGLRLGLASSMVTCGYCSKGLIACDGGGEVDSNIASFAINPGLLSNPNWAAQYQTTAAGVLRWKYRRHCQVE